jgi:hypothetical protein
MRKWGAKGNKEGGEEEQPQQLDFTVAGGGSEGEGTPRGERKHLGKSGIDQEDAVRFCGSEPLRQAMQQLRIVTLRFGTGRQKLGA